MIIQVSTKQREKLWTRQYIVIILANLSVYLGFHMLPSTIPLFVVSKLGGQETIAGTVIAALTLSALVTRPFAGRLADTYGRKNVYLTGLVICFLSVAAYVFVHDIAVLFIIRLFHGLGWGLATTAAYTMASDCIPQSRLAEGMSFFIMSTNVAMAISPGIALAMISGGNFTYMFAVSASCLILATGLGFSLRTLTKQMDGSPKGSLFEREALFPTSVAGLMVMTYAAVATFVPLSAREAGIGNIGLFYTIYAAAQISVRTFTGQLADKKGLALLVVPGLISLVAALLTLYTAHSLPLFLLAGLLYGFGLGVAIPALMAEALRNLAPDRRGAANATLLNGMDVGITIGSILFGAVAETAGLNFMYLTAIVPVAAAAVLYVLSNRKTKTAVGT